MKSLVFGLTLGASMLAPLVMTAHAADTGFAAALIQDDFQWLETPHDPKALEWAKQHTQASENALRDLPIHSDVKMELEQAMRSHEEVPDITLMGDRAVRMLRNPDHPHGLLQVAERDANGVPGDWKTVLDVDALRQKEGVPYELQTYSLEDTCLPPEFDRCLLRLSPKGGDEVAIREFDLDQGTFVADGFRVEKSRAFAQWMDGDHVLVGTSADGEPTTSAGWPARFRLWERGQSITDAPVVYTAKSSDAIVTLDVFGEGAARHGVITRALDYSNFDVFLVDADGHAEKTPFPRGLKMSAQVATRGHLVVQLSEGGKIGGKHYPAESLLAYSLDPDAEGGHVSVVYTPPEGEYITNSGDIAATGDEVLFVTTHRLVQTLHAAKWDGAAWKVREVLKAEPGNTLTLQPAAGNGGEIVVSTSGFVTPKRQELYAPGKKLRLLATAPTLFDGSKYVTEIKSATSPDGTRVDYYLLKPRQSAWKGAQPTLMTGYAAFGISFRPDYFGYIVGGRAFKLWLERGGSLVLPAARGGGERGDAWHRAAMREKRQNSYDDFIAVLEQLIDKGYTTPARLGVFGSSNGGLLAAVLGTERPDLFNAVISDVPLTDMFRMKHMGMGAAWLDEYGDPDDPKYAKVLRTYSPFHNVREDVDYPPFMITSSTEDNRVGPGHARKLAARLEQVGATVYLLEEQEGGHGVSDVLSNPGLMSLRMTFLIHRLMGDAMRN